MFQQFQHNMGNTEKYDDEHKREKYKRREGVSHRSRLGPTPICSSVPSSRYADLSSPLGRSLARSPPQRAAEVRPRSRGSPPMYRVSPKAACSQEFRNCYEPYKAMNLIDVACILTHRKYHRDRDCVLKRAQNAGVGVVIVPGLTVHGSIQASRLAERYPGQVFFTAGVHPHFADQFNKKSLDVLEDLLSKPECVGVGEIGLDFNRNYSPKDQQMDCFEQQVQLACRLGKPMLLHERESYESFMSIMVKYQARLPPVVVHCFTGTREQALVYLAMGFYIGITGHLVREREDVGVKSLLYADDIPLNKILIETDGPFMFPQPERAIFRPGIVEQVSPGAQQCWDQCTEGRNEPCTLPLLAELIAGCMGRPARQIAEAATHNAIHFFGLHKFDNLNINKR